MMAVSRLMAAEPREVLFVIKVPLSALEDSLAQGLDRPAVTNQPFKKSAPLFVERFPLVFQ